MYFGVHHCIYNFFSKTEIITPILQKGYFYVGMKIRMNLHIEGINGLILYNIYYKSGALISISHCKF